MNKEGPHRFHVISLWGTECDLRRRWLRAQRIRTGVGLHAHLAVPPSQDGSQEQITPQNSGDVNLFLCKLTLTGLAKCLQTPCIHSPWLWNKLRRTQQLGTICIYDLCFQGSGVQVQLHWFLWLASPKAATKVSAWLCSHLGAPLEKNPFPSLSGCWQNLFPCSCRAERAH